MPKRVFAAIIGVVALIAGAIVLRGAVELFGDFFNPAVPFYLNATVELVAASLAFAAFAIGVGWLGFSWDGRTHRNSWVTPVLIGIGCFFPAFLLSLPATLLWARHTWPGDGQNSLAAAEVSMYVGVAAQIITGVLLLRKRKLKTKNLPA